MSSLPCEFRGVGEQWILSFAVHASDDRDTINAHLLSNIGSKAVTMGHFFLKIEERKLLQEFPFTALPVKSKN